ncbi:MAG: DJ-1/PfpI family protein [Leucobacter sp.]
MTTHDAQHETTEAHLREMRDALSGTADGTIRDPEAQAAWDRSVAAHHALAVLPGVTTNANEDIVIVLHPDFDTLDVLGPHYFLSSMMGANIHFATTGELDKPVRSASGIPLQPTTTLADAPEAATVLLVPGGDTSVLLKDQTAISRIRELAACADLVTSVCTGAIALGAAGLLDGRRATSHWSVRHLLPEYGATAVDERVVADGNVLTAAGVTAGMDLALTIVGRLRGAQYARFLELGAEYASKPPHGAGTPQTAGPDLTALARDFFAPVEHSLRRR